jgi:hypothetical protein
MGVDGPLRSSQQFGVSPYPELDKKHSLRFVFILLRTNKLSPKTPFSLS